jgi:hypothetical protein
MLAEVLTEYVRVTNSHTGHEIRFAGVRFIYVVELSGSHGGKCVQMIAFCHIIPDEEGSKRPWNVGKLLADDTSFQKTVAFIYAWFNEMWIGKDMREVIVA